MLFRFPIFILLFGILCLFKTWFMKKYK